MNIFTRKTAAVGLTVTGLFALCQPVLASSDVEGGEAADAIAEGASSAFLPMFLIGKGSGDFMATRPGCPAEAGVVGRAYPYGTRILVPGDGGKVSVSLAPNESLLLGNGCEVLVENDPEKAGAKRIQVFAGQVETMFTKDEESVFPVSIVAPSAAFEDLDGRVYVSVGAGPESVKSAVRVADGKVTVHAPQLLPSRLGNSASLVVDTKTDGSFTTIEGLSGDYKLLLENGNAPAYEAAFHVGSRVKIWRSWAPISKLLAVSVLIANVDGAVADSYAFNEGQAPVKNGIAVAKEEASADDSSAGAGADDLSDFGGQPQDAAAANTTADDGWDFNF